MLNVLVLTADLPFFPGKMGVDFFNLRHLAEKHHVAVVSMQHPQFPAEGVAGLEAAVDEMLLWPHPPRPMSAMPALRDAGARPLARWVRKLPRSWKRALLRRLLGSKDAAEMLQGPLSVLNNLAPHIAAALAERTWHVCVLIQSNTASWLDYLPGPSGRMVYFHDVRSHALRRQAGLEGGAASSGLEASARIAHDEELRVAREAEVTAFVSDLDADRARGSLRPRAEVGVSPIPVDTDYFVPRPPDRPSPTGPSVLFTGHLSHPPNVDAVLWFLEKIWPLVRAEVPEAVFRVAGMLPREDLQTACAATAGVELHANVPDIRPYFWDTRAYVVPMRHGGGVRQKLFEAWAMAVPLVCTTMAAEGTFARHGENCWLEDDPAAFARRLAKLLRGSGPEDAAVVARGRTEVLARQGIPEAAGKFRALVERAAAVKRSRPWRLLVDLRWMHIGAAGGMEQMTYELFDAIARLDRRNTYRFLCPRRTWLEWDFPREFQARGEFWEKNEQRAEALRTGAINGLARALRLPEVLTPPMRALRRWRDMDFDFVHSLNSYIHPDLAGFPGVLTMCDLQHRHLPEFFGPEACAERESLYRPSCERARHILCISEWTRQDVHREYGVPLERMSTVWIIPSRAAWLQVDPARRRRLLARMGLEPGRFFFFPAHPWLHKNHARLVEAFALAVRELPPDVNLVFTGRAFEADHPASRLLAEHGLGKRVRHLGYRSPLEMRALYADALALVFPSLFEGFGMPVAEAMIAGCPVACSRSTSLPEIAGDAALFFDPLDPAAIAATLVRLAAEPGLRTDLAAAGLRRRPLFAARPRSVETLSVYNRVFGDIFPAPAAEDASVHGNLPPDAPFA